MTDEAVQLSEECEVKEASSGSRAEHKADMKAAAARLTEQRNKNSSILLHFTAEDDLIRFSLCGVLLQHPTKKKKQSAVVSSLTQRTSVQN